MFAEAIKFLRETSSLTVGTGEITTQKMDGMLNREVLLAPGLPTWTISDQRHDGDKSFGNLNSLAVSASFDFTTQNCKSFRWSLGAGVFGWRSGYKSRFYGRLCFIRNAISSSFSLGLYKVDLN